MLTHDSDYCGDFRLSQSSLSTTTLPPRPVCHTCSTLPPLHHYSARWEPLDLYIILQTSPTLSRENHIQSHIENHLTSVAFSAILQTHSIPPTLFALGENVIELQLTKNTALQGPMLPDQNFQVQATPTKSGIFHSQDPCYCQLWFFFQKSGSLRFQHWKENDLQPTQSLFISDISQTSTSGWLDFFL